ncbi:MAG TPA: pyridoxal-phosphate dependent enzyme, partial [Planctomycetota bacterium]|nr:pyridoxal-phosphate dependent enzyme [Planctomycetota bacterium]
THYLIGSVVGPHPYPAMVRDFQTVIGSEAKVQIRLAINKMPNYLVACVGGGSNAIGLFYPFLKHKNVKMVGVEAAGRGLNTDEHSATLSKGSAGVLHGSYSYLLQDKDGQVRPTHSVSAGLDYPGVGPEHSYFKDTRRVKYVAVTDDEAVKAFKELSRCEGIIPALESSHAIAYTKKMCRMVSPSTIIVVCLSGRGDKDLGIIMNY